MAYLGNSPVLSQQEYRNIDNISGSFNGVTTSFPLLINGVAPVPAPQSSNQCLISVNGVVQKPDDTGASGFRLSGGNIVFSAAPTGGQSFFGVILAGADYIYAGSNFPDGTVTAPSITFAQDLDTGFYRSGAGEVKFTANGANAVTLSANNLTAPSFIPTSSTAPTNGVYLPSANNVAISTNGTGRLFVNSTGQVGVATSPSEAFHVEGTIRTSSAGSNAQFANNFLRSNQAGTFYFDQNSGGQDFQFRVSNSTNLDTTAMTIKSSGRVGLGTSSPGSVLDVRFGTNPANDNGGAANVLRVLTTVSSGADIGGAIALGGKATGTSDDVGFGQIAGRKTNATSGNYAGYLQFSTLGSAGTMGERMRITDTGLVGIGTTSPGSKLTITETANANGIEIRTADSNFSQLALGINTSIGAAYIQSNASGSGTARGLAFYGNSGEWGRFDTSGRFLVGTSTATGASAVQVLKTSGDAFLVRNGDTNYEGFLVQNNSGLVDLIATSGGTTARPAMRFITNDAERMRLDSNGRLCLGNAGAYGAITLDRVGGLNVGIWLNINNTAHYYQQFEYNGGGRIGSITTNGTAVAFNTTSDYRLKENIVPLTNAINRVNQLQVRRFNFISDPSTTVDGFIAHEAETVVPEAVHGTKDEVDENGKPVYQGIDQSKLVPLLTAALQEAIVEIASLKDRVAALESA